MHAIVISTLFALQVAGSAPAQTPVAAEPVMKIEGLPTVYLTDLRGIEYRGQLLRMDPAEVVLSGEKGERIFKRSDIVQIEKRGDSLKNGTLIGAAIGLLAGVGALSAADCPGDQQDSCTGARAAFFVTAVGIYTLIGTGIDAAIQGRTIIYRAPRVTVRLGPAGAAAGLTLRW